MHPSDRELEYLDEDIARLRGQIEAKERAAGEGRVVNRSLWSASLAEMRRRLLALEEERAMMLDA